MTTPTYDATCGATTTSAVGDRVCNRPPHPDGFHRDGDTTWRDTDATATVVAHTQTPTGTGS